MEDRILKMPAELCPDFGPYNYLKEDLYKGKLFGGHNIYYKEGLDGLRGMVTGKRNIEKYGLDAFPTNFTTVGTRDGSRIEEGWSGEILIELLEHLKADFNKRRCLQSIGEQFRRC